MRAIRRDPSVGRHVRQIVETGRLVTALLGNRPLAFAIIQLEIARGDVDEPATALLDPVRGMGGEGKHRSYQQDEGRERESTCHIGARNAVAHNGKQDEAVLRCARLERPGSSGNGGERPAQAAAMTMAPVAGKSDVQRSRLAFRNVPIIQVIRSDNERSVSDSA